MNILDKWISCKYSLAFGLFANDEAGYSDREEGIHENWGCENPEIVDSNRFPVTKFPEGDKITSAAVLYGRGKYNDPEVIAALTRSCGSCQYYEYIMRRR